MNSISLPFYKINTMNKILIKMSFNNKSKMI